MFNIGFNLELSLTFQMNQSSYYLMVPYADPTTVPHKNGVMHLNWNLDLKIIRL